MSLEKITIENFYYSLKLNYKAKRMLIQIKNLTYHIKHRKKFIKIILIIFLKKMIFY